MEKWASVSSHPMYEISDIGRVKRLTCVTKGGRKLKEKIIPQSTRGRYLRVNLTNYSTGKQTGLYVHRLVAIAFIPNPLNLPEVNHIDGNKLNNVAANLEWSDRVKNMTHACRTGLAKHTLNMEAARAIRERIKAGEKQSALAREYSVTQQTISLIVRNQRWID